MEDRAAFPMLLAGGRRASAAAADAAAAGAAAAGAAPVLETVLNVDEKLLDARDVAVGGVLLARSSVACNRTVRVETAPWGGLDSYSGHCVIYKERV